MLKLLSDYLHINIFLLNINEDKIYSVYPEEYFNIYKPNAILSYFKEIFEPFVFKDNKIWKHDTEPFRKLINVDKALISARSFAKIEQTKLFQIKTENLEKYINDKNDEEEKDNNFTEIDIETETEANIPEIKNNCGKISGKSNGVFCQISDGSEDDESEDDESEDDESEDDESEDDEPVDYSDIKKLNTRMKLSEIQIVAKKYDIKIKNGKTKAGKTKYKTKKMLIEEMMTLIEEMMNLID